MPKINEGNTIEFEGKVYERDSRGKYRCPLRCGHPDYPQPSWVSDKGFLKHLAACKGALTWTPEPPQEREKFADCPDCGSPIWKMTSCWRMQNRIVCIECYKPYFDVGIGHHDCAGFDLPPFLSLGE